jgi:hypothetical protein
MYCHADCSYWDDNDRGLGCYGWCTKKNVPITARFVYWTDGKCEFYDGTRGSK